MIFDIKNENDISLLIQAIKGKKIGLTSGSFDLFHHLHLVYLTRCRRLCDLLIVGVDSNDLIAERKGPDRPLVTEHQRVAIVSALACVDAAFIMGSVQDFALAAQALSVDVIFKNEDFAKKKVLGSDQAKVVIIKDIKHSSTTEIIEQIVKMKNPGKKPG
jgi:D-beta-D-heptose 7-phosphate kinase/D-beta-D-heptose 1-phosphate adenosyltransferase